MHAAIQDSETFNARSVNEESGETQVVEDTGNEGEVTEDTTNIVLYQCSICFDYGHNKRTCPHLGRRESESDEDHTNSGEEPGSRETPKKTSNLTDIPLFSPGTSIRLSQKR